jgi:hypothetical protein
MISLKFRILNVFSGGDSRHLPPETEAGENFAEKLLKRRGNVKAKETLARELIKTLIRLYIVVSAEKRDTTAFGRFI